MNTPLFKATARPGTTPFALGLIASYALVACGYAQTVGPLPNGASTLSASRVVLASAQSLKLSDLAGSATIDLPGLDDDSAASANVAAQAISLPNAVAQALRNSAQLSQVRAQYESSEARVGVTRADLLPNASLRWAGSSTDIITGDTVTFTNTSATFANADVGTGKTVSVAGISLAGTDAANYSLQSTTATALADILASNNSGGGGGGGGGNSTTPTFFVIPRPITPTESAESANASNFSTAGENNLLVIPALRPTADSCTPTNLEDCLCETQETRAIEGIQICYQPKKTASTAQGVGRKS